MRSRQATTVPNTAVALLLAKILEVRVEDLFELEGESAAQTKTVTVEVIGGDGDSAQKGQPVQLAGSAPAE